MTSRRESTIPAGATAPAGGPVPVPRTYDVLVVGAGMIGLAAAMKLLERHPGLRVAVLDKEASIGAHQTGHNSCVLHRGIYYAPGSLKAQPVRRRGRGAHDLRGRTWDPDRLLRQAHRRPRRRPTTSARSAPRAGTGERGARPGDDRPGADAGDRAECSRRRRPALSTDRDRRLQPDRPGLRRRDPPSGWRDPPVPRRPIDRHRCRRPRPRDRWRLDPDASPRHLRRPPVATRSPP